MRIDDIFDGEDGRTFIVAEIGSNHNQDMTLAYETIDAAVECGADAVKFQSLDASSLYLAPDDDVRMLHKKIDLREEWHYQLKAYCDQKGTLFFSTPTYLKSIDILEQIDVALYKLASAQVGTFPQLVEKVAKLGKPVLLSTGLVTYGELEKTIGVFKRHRNHKFVVLHCNSIYPAPYEKVNLRLLDVYKSMFGNPVGFSDHTPDIYLSLAAVSIGARVIERHFTLSKNLPVPDSPISLEPRKFQSMVEGIRAVEQAMQFKERIFIEPAEQDFKERLRYRLGLAAAKKKGEHFSENDFDFKRHSEGVDAVDMDMVLNRMQSARDIESGSVLTWNLLRGKDR